MVFTADLALRIVARLVPPFPSRAEHARSPSQSITPPATSHFAIWEVRPRPLEGGRQPYRRPNEEVAQGRADGERKRANLMRRPGDVALRFVLGELVVDGTPADAED